jgi:queuine tRNA-ribosyltransferase
LSIDDCRLPAIPTSSTIDNRRSAIPQQSTIDNRQSTIFGIVQGGVDKDLRRESVEGLLELDFEGYALGGLSVGEPKTEMYEVVEYAARLLPRDRPRYLMGVGTPEDLVECVGRGIDMFDCVMPTRNARNGGVFTSQGKMVIKNAKYAQDESPLDPACSCPVCRRYSRSYIRHLLLAGEMLGAILTSQHNLHFYIDRMRKIRQSLLSGAFSEFHSRARAGP